jgi:hypothetical protein
VSIDEHDRQLAHEASFGRCRPTIHPGFESVENALVAVVESFDAFAV